MATLSSQIQGNEYIINLSQNQYDDAGTYWIQLADKRATATKQVVLIVIGNKVIYRATPETGEYVK